MLCIIIPLLMLIATPAHSAERELHDSDQKISTESNVTRHKPPAWAEESRKNLILLLQEICNLPTDLGSIIVDMMGDCGYGKLFPHITIKNRLRQHDATRIITLSDERFAVAPYPDKDTIEAYDSDGNLQHILKHGDNILSLYACSNGTGIVANSFKGTVKVWDISPVKKARLRKKFSQLLSTTSHTPNRFLELSPHRLVIGNPHTLRLLDTQNKKYLLTSELNKLISTPLTKLSTENIAVGYDYAIPMSGIIVWNTTTGALLCVKHAHDGHMRAIAALPYGLLATASYIHSLQKKEPIKVWNSANGSLLHALYPQQCNMTHSLVALPDGNLAAGSSGLVDIWNPISGTHIRTLHNGTIDIIHTLLPLPHGRLAAGGICQNITIWDVKEGECLQTLFDHNGCSVILKLLSNGNLLSADSCGNIKIWKNTIDHTIAPIKAPRTPPKPRTLQASSPSQKSQSYCRIS